jgi:chaperonin cofactor prefoldin
MKQPKKTTTQQNSTLCVGGLLCVGRNGEQNVTKLQKLHDRFEVVARQIESTEDKINECIDKDRDTSKWDHKLEKLQDKEYEIQCKIEKLEGGVK